MKRLLTLVLFLFSISLTAQDFTASPMKFSHEWYSGQIILTTGDTVNCMLRYNRTSLDGVVHVKEAEHVIAITTPYIKSFSFYDDSKARTRTFVNLTLPGLRKEDQQFLVEKLYDDGRYSILNQRTYEMPYQNLELIRFLGKPVPVYKKYIQDNSSGELLPLTRANTLKILDERKEEVSSFIHQNNIRFRKISDFIDVLEYHSSL